MNKVQQKSGTSKRAARDRKILGKARKEDDSSPAPHRGAQANGGKSLVRHRAAAVEEPSLAKATFKSMKRAGLFDVAPDSTTSFSRIEALIYEVSFGLLKVQGSIIKSLNGERDRHTLSALARLERLSQEVENVTATIFKARGDRNRARLAVQS